MADRDHGDDLTELMQAAEQALRQALADGERKGFAQGDWRTRSFDHHLEHADQHVANLTRPELLQADTDLALEFQTTLFVSALASASFNTSS